MDNDGKEVNHPVELPRCVVFALTSDLAKDGKPEHQRYKEMYDNDYPWIRAICVAGKEYCHESHGAWVTHGTANKFDETLSFIGGVNNTYKRVAHSRGWPNLGHYVIDSLSSNNCSPSGTLPIVQIKCEQCKHNAYLYFKTDNIPLNVKEGYVSNEPCSKCGGRLVAPSGKYSIQNGELLRIGDFSPKN